MLCYHYPPVQSAATPRSVAFSTLLREFGWITTVLTVKDAKDRWVAKMGDVPMDVRIERTAEWDLTGLLDLLHGATRRALRPMGLSPSINYYRELLGFPDPQIAWLTTLRGLKLAREHDVVYASCPPFSSALSALCIGGISRKPVVLDFRDAWFYDLAGYHSGRYQRCIARLEGLVFNGCCRLIVTSQGAGRLYGERFPAWSHKLSVIPNGYDELTPLSAVDSCKFRIVHIGTFHGTRDPKPLLRALARIQDSRIEFVHVGQPCDELDMFSTAVSIRQLGVLPREKALEVTRTASLLYLRQGMSNAIAIAAKTYEYLATGLPVLCHGPEGDNAAMIRRYGLQSFVVTSDEEGDLECAIRSVLRAWPNIMPAIHPDFIRKFNRRHFTRRLSQLLTEVVDPTSVKPNRSDEEYRGGSDY